MYITASSPNVIVSPETHSAGDSVGGGLFVLEDSGYAYISAAADQSDKAPWGCRDLNIDGTLPEIGTGESNTNQIISVCTQSGTSAEICEKLTLNGYSDWFLPSLNELEQMYIQLASKGFGGFANQSYWSSTQYDPSDAYTIDFNNGNANNHRKDQTNRHTRAMRRYLMGDIDVQVVASIDASSSSATVISYPTPIKIPVTISSYRTDASSYMIQPTKSVNLTI
jgi:hypothetical protein